MIGMKYTQIGNNAVLSSVVGLGCWAIGGREWGRQLDSDSIAALKTAFDKGITHFDTAQGYNRGHAEELIGRSLHKVRHKIFIATKMLFTPAEKVEQSLMQSLQRLKTDYVDLLYIHWPKKNADFTGMMEALEIMRKKGCVRAIGVSNFTVDQMKEIMKAGTVDANQMCYNLLWRWPEKDLIPFCNDNGIAVVAYGTIAQGILTGKFTSELQFPPGDHRKKVILFDNEVWPSVYRGVEELKACALSVNMPLADLAVQWVLRRNGINTALVGARNAAQARENAAFLDNPADRAVFDQLTEISDRIIKNIPDTGNIFRWYP